MGWTHDCATLLGDNVLRATAQTYAYYLSAHHSVAESPVDKHVMSRDKMACCLAGKPPCFTLRSRAAFDLSVDGASTYLLNVATARLPL